MTLGWVGGWIDKWVGGWLGMTMGNPAMFPGQGPAGVHTFALDFENGYEVTWLWPADIIPKKSGREQRISINDRAKDRYSSSAPLFGDERRDVRTKLARYAASGSLFSLGLPHEQLTIRAHSVGTTVYVHNTALSDWMNPGQRVVVMRRSQGVTESIDAVIQSVTADSITLDVTPGTTGRLGAVIMPIAPIYIDAHQKFDRRQINLDHWKLQARAAVFDFARVLASLALGPLTAHAGLDAATVTARFPGVSPTFALLGDGIGAATLEETSSAVTIHALLGGGSPTTIAQAFALLQASTVMNPTGTWGAGNLGAGDAVAATALSGGQTAGPVGTGATVTTYDGHPVWDRDLKNDGTVGDSIHALTELVEYTGVPTVIGVADQPAWGRSIQYEEHTGLELQWLKLFLATTKGPQKAFWLPTHADDLPFVSKAAGTVTVETDVPTWWPLQRQHIQIKETNGTITRAEITAVTNNGDGTYTLTIGTTIATSSVSMISWLELCRFEQPRDELGQMQFPVTFGDGGTFAIDWQARVVPE